MAIECSYGFGCQVDLDFEAATAKVEKLLSNRGFKILTRLHLCELLAEKDKKLFGRYVILGACNRDFAGELFNADINIGLLMPCNIVVYELKSGGCRIMIKDPLNIMDLITNPRAIETAIRVKEQLEELVEEMQKKKSVFPFIRLTRNQPH